MKKIKILDTNVLLNDHKAMFNFPKELVIIPLSVIDELDTFKKDQTELGKNAREVSRKLDKLIKKNTLGQISAYNDESPGIELKHGGRLLVEQNHIDTLKDKLDIKIVDNKIISTAKYYSQLENTEVTIVSKDMNLRIKANIFNVQAIDYEGDADIVVEDQYKGYQTFEVSDEKMLEIVENGYAAREFHWEGTFHPNEYIVFTQEELVAIGKYNYETKMISLIPSEGSDSAYEITAKNVEQRIALDLLLDPSIPLITITGKAGTGKTLLAVAAALEQSEGRNSPYSRILISRPIVPMGKDIGYLPGSLEEKLDPWMQPIFDNLEYIFNAGNPGHASNNGRYKELIDQGIIQVEALTYIRGRSIPNQFFIIDESQNLSKHEIKTILSRVGEGTKIVLTGDPDQIDSPYLDKVSCGLSQVVEKFKDSPLAGHIKLEKGERSKLAEAVVDLFK